jgi:hypothetical protein
MLVSKAKKLSTAVVLLLGCTTGYCATNSTVDWSKHVGSYLGYTMGYNTMEFTLIIPVSGQSLQSHHAFSQELIGGYMKTPNYGVEFGVGSVVSSLGICARAALKGVLPISNRFSLDAQGGFAIIGDAVTDTFYSPYGNAGFNYALSRDIELNVSESYLYADKKDWYTKNNNLWSTEIGFVYHIR